MRVIFIFVLIAAWLAPTPLYAQSETQRAELDTPLGTLSIEVPVNWESTVSGDPNYYLFLSNRRQVQPGEVLTDIQVILTTTEALLEVTDDPIDLSSDNPALDYLQKYAAWSGNIGRGVYDPPRAIDANGIPAAMMLYVEQLDSPRFGESEANALSLAIALYLGEDNFLVMLLDGAASSGQLLFTIWTNTLQSLRLDGETPPFVDAFRTLLREFTAPELLRQQMLALPGMPQADIPTQTLYVDNVPLTVPVLTNWETVPASDEQALILSNDIARISVRFVPLDPLAASDPLVDALPLQYHVVDSLVIVDVQREIILGLLQGKYSDSLMLVIDDPNTNTRLIARVDATDDRLSDYVADWLGWLAGIRVDDAPLRIIGLGNAIDRLLVTNDLP